eukprot:TRINITY_DN6178_c0_g1_i1.p1 TRINITY_DN6178_c0_g1~~TRINITY_DN6178_c0_g1_i1.p1  ORF type:complete len:866 (+),score=159.39 TRINITY_DN6178_c0_g1_i1:44-2641(+)
MAETVSDIKGEKSNLTFKNEARWENVLASRILRIFLSSTFRDMQRERDTFFQHGEPRLREWARKKGVILHFIDLRWGLTREVSDNGEVTIRCYQSIEQCPYFVCTLGARYGWIPDHSNPSEWHPDTDKHYPFLNELGHLSVTHYEIQYGALMQKAIARKSFFYERDENHVLTSAPDLTPEERVLYQAVNMKDKINQDAMKQEISLQYQIKVYKDSKQLSEWIVDDLITSMEVDFAGISAAPDDEDFAHEQLMRHRLNGFKGRDDTIQQLRANIDRQLITKGSKIAMIFGEPGVGKTSSMTAFVQQLEINPKLCVFYHFAGCSSVSLLVDSIVQRIYRSLFHRKVLSNAPDTEIGQETIKKGLYEVLRQASKKANIRVVVILDGVDQLVDSPAYPHVHQLHWLPKLLPRNVAMVISTTKEHASYPVAQSAGFDAVSLLPLTAPEVLQVADAYMFGYDKTLSLVQKDMILRDIRDCSHPLYLRIILEELRVFGIYETVNKELEDLLSTNGVIELFTIVLKRWEQKYDTILVLSSDIAFSLVRTVVSVLCISRMGLNDDELDSYVNYRFGKKLQGEEVSVWKSFFFKLLDSLYVRNGRYTFIHRLLEEAAKLRYLSNPDLELYEMRAYGSWLLERFDFDQQEAPTVAEICHTLSYSRDYPKLAEFLSKQKVVDAMLGGRHKYEFYSHWRVLNKNGFDHKSVYQDMLKDTSSTGDYLVSYFQDVQERDFLVPIIHDRISMRTNEDEKLVDYGWLASVYDDMAQYEKSLEYYRKAIAIKIKKFGEKHTSVAHSYNNMGGVYCSMGKYNRAHEYHRKSLAIKTKLLGEGHMDVATSYCNVAIVYINQGMYAFFCIFCIFLYFSCETVCQFS